MTALEIIQAELAKHARLPPWEQGHQPFVTVRAEHLRALVERLDPAPAVTMTDHSAEWGGGDV